MPIGSTVVYNPGDLILHNVSGSGNTFQEVKIAAATSSIIVFNNNGILTSQSLNATTVGTSSYFSGSSAIIGNLTASNISASGNTILNTITASGLIATNGPLIVSGSNAYLQLFPVGGSPIPNNTTASYIYTSGSTNDLYFTQYNGPYTNTTRLRWLESNLYTGILYGGTLSSTPGSTTFNVASGSGIIVAINATTGSDPYPTIKQINWPRYTNQPIQYSGSAKITYVGLDNNGQIVQQTNAWGSSDINQWDTQINLGVVLHLSGSVSTGVFNSPQISYGYPQKTDDFFRAFGPLKISGHTLQASGSSPTLSIKKTGGTSYREGANYVINPNHPSTVVENDITASKIYRYYMSGSTPIIDTGINNAGYTTIDNLNYVDTTTGTLATVGNSYWSIQRVFWIPNSPTNAFIVYYGNARYGNLLTATNAKDSEPFTEAPNTALNAIFIGYIIVEGGGSGNPPRDLLNANESTIIQGGLFRNVGGIGSGGTSPVPVSLANLSDVAISSVSQGDLLIYGNGTQWNNGKNLNGNYVLTGSLTTNNVVTAVTVTASAFTGSFTGSLLGTSSWATNSVTASSLLQSNSYIITNLTASNISASNTIYTSIVSASNAIYLTGSNANINASGNSAAFNIALNNNQSATFTMNAQTPNILIKSVANGNQSFIGSNSSGTNIFYGFSGSSSGGGTYINFSQNGANNGFHITQNNSADLFNINTSGNVGINVATASNVAAKLHISGSSANETELLVQNSSGTNLLFVSSSGNIGIGTNNPIVPLDIATNPSTTGLRLFYSGGQQLNLIAGTSGTGLFQSGSGYLSLGVNSNGNLGSPTGEVIRITNAALVGIGTTNPQNKLDVAGAVAIGSTYAGVNIAPANGLLVQGIVGVGVTNPTASIEVNTQAAIGLSALRLANTTGQQLNLIAGSSGTGLYQSGSGFLAFGINSNGSLGSPSGEIIRITNAGLVGIGTTVPVNKLDVAGNISCSAITASTFFGTSSWSNNSLTSSYITASNVVGTVTSASYALSSSYSPTTITASWATNSLTASYLTTTNNYQITNLTAASISASGGLTASAIVVGTSSLTSGYVFETTNGNIKLGTSRASQNQIDVYGNLNFKNNGSGVTTDMYITNEGGLSRAIKVPGNGGNGDWIIYNTVGTGLTLSDPSGSGSGSLSLNPQQITLTRTSVAGGGGGNFIRWSVKGPNAGGGVGYYAFGNPNAETGTVGGSHTYIIAANGGTVSGTNAGGNVYIDPGSGSGGGANGKILLGTNTSSLVGIGVANPINTLDVAGNISCSAITASNFFGTSSWSSNALTASYLTPTNSYTITNLTASGTASVGFVGIGTTLTLSPQLISYNHNTNGNGINITKTAGNGTVINVSQTNLGQANTGLSFVNTDTNTNLVNANIYGIYGSISSGLDSFAQYAGYFSSTQTRTTSGTNGGTPYGIYAIATTTGSAPSGYAAYFVAGDSNTIPLTLKGAGSQTANLMQVLNSSGTLLFNINASGNLSASGNISASIFVGAFSGSHFGTSSWAQSSSYSISGSVIPTTANKNYYFDMSDNTSYSPSYVETTLTYNPSTKQLSGSNLGISASLYGTSSWATNSLTSALATSINFTASNATFSQTASYLTPANSYTITNLTASSISASGTSIINNLTTLGTTYISNNSYVTGSGNTFLNIYEAQTGFPAVIQYGNANGKSTVWQVGLNAYGNPYGDTFSFAVSSSGVQNTIKAYLSTAGNFNLLSGSLIFNGEATSNLYRSATGTIKTDGNFVVGGTTTTVNALSASGIVASNGITGGTTGGRNAVVATNDGTKLQTSFTLYQPGNTTDQKYWELISLNSGSTLSLRTINDAYTLSADIFRVNRTTSYFIDGITFPNGNITASGTISASGAVIATSFTGSFSGSIANATSASYALSASYAPGGSGLSGGTTNYIPLWTSATALSSSKIYQTGSSVLIGQTTFNATAAEALAVSGSTFNVISGYGNLNNYLQLNIKNINNGNTGSSDIVATNDQGSETQYYVDLGINSSGHVPQGDVGAANDGYLYNTGSDFYIGNATPSKNLYLYAGGATNTSSVVLTSANNVGIGTTNPSYKLQVIGSFSATTKSFDIEHPTKSNKRLVYGSLESPYHGVRLTGKGKLIKGKGIIQLPDYMNSLVDYATVNIQITNIKHSKIIYVDDIDEINNIINVASKVSKTQLNKELEFYWTFTAVRKDVPELTVEV